MTTLKFDPFMDEETGLVSLFVPYKTLVSIARKAGCVPRGATVNEVRLPRTPGDETFRSLSVSQYPLQVLFTRANGTKGLRNCHRTKILWNLPGSWIRQVPLECAVVRIPSRPECLWDDNIPIKEDSGIFINWVE